MDELGQPKRRATFLPGLALGLALALAGCAGTMKRPDGLYFRPPVSAGGQSVMTSQAPSEVVQSLQDAGFTDVRVMRDGSVRLRTTNLGLVDCGTMIQVALGNEAEFPGNSAQAVLMAGSSTPGLIRRDMMSESEVRLTPLPTGGGYAIDEAHRVTKVLVSLTDLARSTASISFDETSVAAFPDKTACRSSGLIGQLLR